MKKFIIIISIFSVTIFSCKKKEPIVPVEIITETSKYELIPGEYQMYDTLGNYLYDMKITYWTGEKLPNGYPRDTFQFDNIDGQFSFKHFQSEGNVTSWPKNYFYLGHHDPLYDSLNNRYQFFGYDAHFSNDSIYLYYEICNIKYYLYDASPYVDRYEKQVGVKKH